MLIFNNEFIGICFTENNILYNNVTLSYIITSMIWTACILV